MNSGRLEQKLQAGENFLCPSEAAITAGNYADSIVCGTA